MNRISSSQAALKSEVTGEGAPIVLVPGGLTGWLSWKPHAEKLAANYKVVRVQLLAVDLGLQDQPLPPNYSVDYETQALARTLDDVGVEQAHFVAWSYGGLIALNFALNAPQRVKTLTLIEPPAIWVLRSRGPLSDDLLQEQKTIQALGPGAVSEAQLEWFTHFAGFVPRNVDPKTLPQWKVWVKHMQSLRTGDVVYRHEDDIRRVRKFSKPVLLFKGTGSSAFLHQAIDVLAAEFPNARVETLPGAHAPQIVSMEPFMQRLDSFLKSGE